MSDNIKSIAVLGFWGASLWLAFLVLAIGLWATGMFVNEIINRIF